MLELVYYYNINYWVNIVITIYPQCLVSIKTCSAISSTANKSSVGMTQLEVYREIYNCRVATDGMDVSEVFE